MVEVFREHYLVKEYGPFFIFEMTNNLFFFHYKRAWRPCELLRQLQKPVGKAWQRNKLK